MTIKKILLAAALAGILGLAQARSTALVEAPRVILASGLTEELVKSAVLRGGAKHDWVMQADAPGKLTLKQNKSGKHEAVVDVSYDASGFQIRYVSSINLNYSNGADGAKVHPTYIRWVNNLEKAISAEANSASVK